MENRNCELLFDYLHSILKGEEHPLLDVEQLEEPYRKLGRELHSLQEVVSEAREYAADLSRGDLSREYPAQGNFLCTHLKELHSNLKHLTWQAKRVAMGDYSQHVSYLGEFSDAFNEMTDQLKEREALLEAEQERTRQRMAQKAYFDPGTGIHNRLYFEEYMQNALHQKQDFTLGYMDLDDLKSVNDRFGHNEGDNYIRNFVSVVRHQFRGTDLLARIGGDEFCIVVPACIGNIVANKLQEAERIFATNNKKQYRASFSYGLIEVRGGENTMTLDEIIQLADTRMYQCKRENKKKYEGKEG